MRSRQLASATAAIGQPHEAVFDHGVAAAMLGGIERGVGGLDQVAWAAACRSGLVQATPTLTVTV